MLYLMLIAYFSLTSLTMMVISVCVNDTVHLLYILIFKSGFGSSCDFLITPCWSSVYYKDGGGGLLSYLLRPQEGASC